MHEVIVVISVKHKCWNCAYPPVPQVAQMKAWFSVKNKSGEEKNLPTEKDKE